MSAYPERFEWLLRNRYGHLNDPHILTVNVSTLQMVRTWKCHYHSLNAHELSKIFNLMAGHIPKELWSAMRQRMLKWARKQDDSKYFTRILNMDWNNGKFLEFAMDSDRNVVIVHKMQDFVRVIQSHHPNDRIRTLDWMLPMKWHICSKVIQYWLNINDPKKYGQRHHLHVFWKWNALDSRVKSIDWNPCDLFDARFGVELGSMKATLRPRVTITSSVRDLGPSICQFWNPKAVVTVTSNGWIIENFHLWITYCTIMSLYLIRYWRWIRKRLCNGYHSSDPVIIKTNCLIRNLMSIIWSYFPLNCRNDQVSLSEGSLLWKSSNLDTNQWSLNFTFFRRCFVCCRQHFVMGRWRACSQSSMFCSTINQEML